MEPLGQREFEESKSKLYSITDESFMETEIQHIKQRNDLYAELSRIVQKYLGALDRTENVHIHFPKLGFR